MSLETRKKRRLDVKNSRFKMLLLVSFVFVILMIVGLIKDKQAVLTKTVWTKDTDAVFYFFKAVNDAEVDDFNAKTITVEPGGKTNGYTVLASQELTVNVEWAERQCQILKNLIDRNVSVDWETLINQTVQAGEDTIVIDTKKVTLAEIAPYIGFSVEELTEKYVVMERFITGQSISINLDNLDLIRSGAVYTSTTNRRRVLNENFLPYLSTSLLKAISRTDRSSQNALTVIGNDHVYVVTVLDEETEIFGEDQALTLKAEHISATGVSEKNYYEMLTSRDDLVRQYPSLNMEINGETTEAYLIDSRKEEDKKILVLMIKNDTSYFLKEEKADGTLETQRVYGYVVPKSAIKYNNEGRAILTRMEKAYFSDAVEVTLTAKDGSYYILKASDNPNLSEGDIYKVHP